jgi:pyruvate oxidase
MVEYGYPVYRVDFPNPDFAQFAKTAGGSGFRVEDPEDLDEAFRKAMASSLPSIIDVKIDPEKYIEAIHRV